MTPNRAMQYPNFCKLPLAEVETVQKMNLNHTPEKAKKRTLAREQGEQEMETKKMSISKAIKLAVKNVSYHGSGMYSVSDDTSVWEHTLRAGSNPIIAIRNLRVLYAMRSMYGEDGEVFTQLRSDALSQPGTLREIVKMENKEYNTR